MTPNTEVQSTEGLCLIQGERTTPYRGPAHLRRLVHLSVPHPTGKRDTQTHTHTHTVRRSDGPSGHTVDEVILKWRTSSENMTWRQFGLDNEGLASLFKPLMSSVSFGLVSFIVLLKSSRRFTSIFVFDLFFTQVGHISIMCPVWAAVKDSLNLTRCGRSISEWRLHLLWL